MPLPAAHLQSVQAAVKMANAPDLSLRGGRRPTRRPERAARGSALGVQSREGTHDFADDFPVIQLGAARFPRRFAPRNDTSGWCRGAPAPLRGLMLLHKAVTDRHAGWQCCGIDSMARGSLNCHCEEAAGRRGNLGKAVTFSPKVSCYPPRFCEIAPQGHFLALRAQGATSLRSSK